MNDEDAFQTALDRTPEDGALRQVFADWLDERVDPRGPGYRELGRLGLRPDFHRGCPPWNAKEKHGNNWTWWESGGETLRHCTLPPSWYAEVRTPYHYTDQSGKSLSKDFYTRREAEDEVALAFSRIPGTPGTL